MQMNRSQLFGLVVLAVLTVLTATPLLAEKKQNDAQKVAVVNGAVITQEDYNREIQAVQQRFASMGQIPNEAQLGELKQAVLDKMIETKLLYQEAQEQGFTVSDERVNKEIANIKAKFPSEEQFTQSMTSMNISQSELRSQLKQGLTIEKFIEQKFVDQVKISDEEAKKFYEENKGDFKQPEMVKASHILVTVPADADEKSKKEARQKIEKVQKELKEGGDFAALAKEHSQCPSSAKGGDLGFFGRGQMVPPFEEAAFALEPGKVSDIVETQFGYHLIKVQEKKPEGTVSFEEAKERIKQFLSQQKVKEQVESYLAKVKEDATIKTFPPAGEAK